MSKSIFFFAPAIVIVLILAAISGQYQITKNPATPATPTFPAKVSVMPSPTPVWKTYANSKYKFSLAYQSNWEFYENRKNNVEDLRLVFYAYDISVSPVILTVNGEPGTISTTPSEKIINNIRWSEYLSRQTCSPEECMPRRKELVVRHNGNVFMITTYEDSWEAMTRVLSTFKFLDQIPTLTTTASKVKLLNTSGWQQVKYKNISFKIPKDWVFNELGLTNNSPVFKDSKPMATADTPVILSPEDFGHPLVVREYNGGSRRQWYLDYLKETGETTQGSSVKFQEIKLGKTDALDIIIDNIYGFTPTLVSHGQTIVAIGYDSNNRDKRNPIIDTIISTIEFNN